MAWSIDSILQDPVLERVGWALLHSVWQAAAIAGALAASMRLTRSSQNRYLLACVALILSLLAPAATVWITADPSAPVPEVRQSTAAMPRGPVNFDRPGDPTITQSLPTGIPSQFIAPAARPLETLSLTRAALPYASILWALVVIILCIGHVGGLFTVRSLRRSATPITDEPTHARLTRLMKRLAIRQRVSLSECARTTIPCVIGFCRPMILLPVGMIANLSPQYLESILAHELAHIRRHDYLVNLAQIAIETLLFYHPAIWWISKQIRAEREHCCDDLAVEIVGDATTYSEALTAIEEIRIDPSHALALGATGGSLLHRIERLLNRSTEQPRAAWPIASSLLAILLMICLAFMTHRRSSAIGQTTAPASQPSASLYFGLGRQIAGPSVQIPAFPSSRAFTLEQRLWMAPRIGATQRYAQFQDGDTVIFDDNTVPTAVKVGSGTLQIGAIGSPPTPTTHLTTRPSPTTGSSGDAGFRLNHDIPFIPAGKPASGTLNVIWGPSSAPERNSLSAQRSAMQSKYVTPTEQKP